MFKKTVSRTACSHPTTPSAPMCHSPPLPNLPFGGSGTSLSFGVPLVILIVADRPKCHRQTGLKDCGPMAGDRDLIGRTAPADDLMSPPPPESSPFTSFVVRDMSCEASCHLFLLLP
ncbi:hypothetical protein JTE90_014641 [Oedothorax gibbosus]|uniref:Uncharacterized protein n=1 Tax=Oedothorax gibbosus TaxID=931172 RepID=A0AAV6V836_9ARAC|nr:hypothetical protein JTE90_014641 [Oedothorax gibbosus]